MPFTDPSRNQRFEADVLPHSAAAFNLARWLTRREADAADIVQEALMRALQYFGGYRGGDVRSWLLSIVRNCAYSWLKSNPPSGQDTAQCEWESAQGPWEAAASSSGDPMGALVSQDEATRLRRAIARLPAEHREVLILREFEDLSYRQIATIVGSPIGTVMSRLSRARDELGTRLRAEADRS